MSELSCSVFLFFFLIFYFQTKIRTCEEIVLTIEHRIVVGFSMDSDLNEVDAFNENRDKMLLEEAGDYLGGTQDQLEDASDEEVMPLEDEQSEDDESEEHEMHENLEDINRQIEEEEEERGWGSRENYYGGDDSSEEENDREMTEEALRQQKKHLQELAMEDYVDQEMEEDWKKKAEDFDSQADSHNLVLGEVDVENLNNLDEKERNELLNNLYPEFKPLVVELERLHPLLATWKRSKASEVIDTKYTALAAYISTVASYFAIFFEKIKKEGFFSTMKNEPVMEAILQAREVWRQANELPENAATTENDYRTNKVEEGPVEESMSDEVSEDNVSEKEMSENKGGEEKQEKESPTNTKGDIVSSDDELDIDIYSERNIPADSQRRSYINDFTEDATPEVDLEDKKRRKKSLRFYTSKIDQATAKNNRSFLEGDTDLPYKERLNDRRQRLNEEARERGAGKNTQNLGDDLDDNEWGSEDGRDAANINNVDNSVSNQDYYDSLVKDKRGRKDARKSAHEKAKKAAKEGKLAEIVGEQDPESKRALNYQILKNKGLGRKKNQERNLRLKKRKKYEKAKKKLKSVRPVYDPSNKGPYEGEKTGIRKGLSRSVKLV